MDITDTLAANSTQLNADDLIGGSVVVCIERVTRGDSEEQPVVVHLTDRKPWKPCKSMRRVLVAAWGADTTRWCGRSVELYRDPSVRFGAMEVGGIRVAKLTDIDGPLTLALAVKRGQKAPYRVDVLHLDAGPMTLATFRQHLGGALKAGWSREDIAALMGTAKAEDVNPDDYRGIVAALKERP